MRTIVLRERTGIRLVPWGALAALALLGALWSCATERAEKTSAPISTAENPDTTKTTIRIVKGRVGYPSLWTATIEDSPASLAIGGGQPIPPALWERMNGTVESFTEYGCDGTATELIQPLYTVLNEKGGPEGVKVVGDAGQKPDWGSVYCDATGCFLPAYYFNKVVKDPRTCPESGKERQWVMVMK